MKAGDVINAAGYEVEKIQADAWTVRKPGDLWVVSTWPDGRYVGVPWAIHAVQVAEQMCDEMEAFQAANRAAGLVPF